ncbi:endo-beta-N-acetylglucosaminidase [Erysipelothrix aquatica]|uniref:endo-beta-N-acetylglucosaminidase n=1 Tax=Erysipelothrix aquatica TaxID=2683714 RepID=UPI00135B8E91|nr:discoidin domain-containing protein [Erysipelothrix aquatica]
MKKNENTRFVKSLFRSACIGLTATTLAFTMFASNMTIQAAITGDGTDAVNENYENGKSLQPLAPAFRLETLLKWSPETDPDAKLNRSTVPLESRRFQGQQINKLANPEAKITSAAISNANHDQSPSTGGEDFNIYAFDNWQYLDSMIYWASSEEGVIAVPSPDIVDAAHRNGVPVYATLHFPWGTGHYDSLKELENMSVQDEEGNYPVADKLIEIAQYFGFDGYFFNQESYGSTEKVAQSTHDMLVYVRQKSREMGYPINIGWYDAMANSGSVSHQDAVNKYNDLWLRRGSDNDYAVDEFFMNFNWSPSKIQSTHDYMRNTLDRNPYDAYAGFEIQQNSYKTKINTDALVDDNGKALSSIALYAPNSTMGFAASAEEFNKHEQILYTGPQGDPSLADDSADWKGMSRFVTDKSVIEGTSFGTSFNAGHGKKWFVDGVEVRDRTWNYRSAQDIMPTWRWWVKDQVGTRLAVDYDFNDAYNGGNSLKLSGNLAAGSTNNVMLYSTKLDVSQDTELAVTLKGNTAAKVEVGVSFDENYVDNDLTYFPVTSNEAWGTQTIDLGAHAGKTIYAVSIRVSNADTETLNLNVGQLTIDSKTTGSLANTANARVDETLVKDAREASARLSWDAVEGTDVYEVYQVNKDGKEVLLGATPNTAFYADKITRTDANAKADDTTTIRIRTLDASNNRSDGKDITFEWGVSLDGSDENNEVAPVNVALNAQVTAVSFENDAEPASKALDGTATGNSKWAATNKKSGYMDIKLSEPQRVSRWRVEHAEYGGEANNMNTVDFSLQYKDENGQWQIAKAIKGNTKAVTDVLLDTPITAQEWKLDVTNSGTSPWGAIRIYEWQMFDGGFTKTPMVSQYQIKADFEGKKVTVSEVEAKATVRLYDAITATEAVLTGVANDKGVVIFEDVDFTKFGERIYVTTQNEGIEESLKNSIQNYVSRKSENMYIHAYVGEMGLNTTFDVIDAMGKVRNLGGTSDSGLNTQLPVGTYDLVLTSIPVGVKYDGLSIPFTVVEGETNELIIRLNYFDNYEALGLRIYQAGSFKEADYSASSFATLKAAIETAKVIHQNQAIEDNTYTDALSALNEAIDGLVPTVDKAKRDLGAAIKNAEKLKEKDYSKATYANLVASITEAKAVIATENATLEMIQDAHTALNNAIDALEAKPELIDKKEVVALLNTVESLDQDQYNEASQALLETLIYDAKAIIADDEATQETVDAIIVRLQTIESQLIKKVDKSLLVSLIAAIGDIDATQYTEASYEVFSTHLANAKAVLENEAATQVEINEAYEALHKAFTGLVDVKTPQADSIALLKQKLVDAKAIETDKYTQETVLNLETAIEFGDNVVNNLPVVVADDATMFRLALRSTSTQQDVLDAIDMLDKAVSGLKEKDPIDPVDPVDPVDPTNPVKPTTPDKTTDKDKLPATGVADSNTMMVSSLIVGAGLVTVLVSKRKRKETE